MTDDKTPKAIEALTLLEESEGARARGQLAAASKRRANELAFGGEVTAALAVPYPKVNGLPKMPTVDDILMIDPPPESRK